MSTPIVTRIRAKSDGAKVSYKLGTSAIVLSGEAPLPATFLAALAELESHVAKLLSLPPKYAEGLRVTGANFAEKDEGEAVVILAEKTFREGGNAFKIQTPLRFMAEPLCDEDASAVEKKALAALCVDDVLRSKLETLRAEAVNYVKNCSEQRQLYLGLGEPEAPAEAKG